MTTEDIVRAEATLQLLDPVLGECIVRHGTIQHRPQSDYFTSLAEAIVGQQLSVKTAARIFERFVEITQRDPKRTTQLTTEEVKIIGLSAPKARYIQDLAQHFVNDSAVFTHLDSLRDDDVIKELTAIKGIGVWTAHMFLMFTLVRPDVFAPDDAGLQRAIKNLYNFTILPSRGELETFAERWKPYRTVACWHLWCSLDNQP